MSKIRFFPKWRGAGDLVIGPVRYDAEANSVTAEVDGHPVWFQCEGAQLCPDPEAFAAVFLIPAALAGRRLQVHGGVSQSFADSAMDVLQFIKPWWGGGVFQPGPVRAKVAAESTPALNSRSALCFSCGVDAFYSLYEFNPEVLVFVAGFDIPISHARALKAAEASFLRVAEKTGKQAVRIRTNFRENPFFRSSHWERAHGGALVALAHLMRNSVSELWISASYADKFMHPWGSHPRLDPLWSTENIRIAHKGSDVDRLQKIEKHGGRPELLAHLRVCWEHPSAEGNCGVCEKCIRNRLCLWYALPDAVCATLPPHTSLVADLAKCALLPDHKLVSIYHRYLKDRDPSDPVVVAVAGYIRRSREALPAGGELKSPYTDVD